MFAERVLIAVGLPDLNRQLFRNARRDEHGFRVLNWVLFPSNIRITYLKRLCKPFFNKNEQIFIISYVA